MLSLANRMVGELLKTVGSAPTENDDEKSYADRAVFELGIVKEMCNCSHPMSFLKFPDAAMIVFRLSGKDDVRHCEDMLNRGFIFMNVDPRPVIKMGGEMPQDGKNAAT